MLKISVAVFLLLLQSCNSGNGKPTSDNTEVVENWDSLYQTDQIADDSFGTYCNENYLYCIEYPLLITKQPESDSRDGCLFTNKRGDIILRVYGAFDINAENGVSSLKRMYRSDMEGDADSSTISDRVITDSILGNNFYKISGTENGKVFHHKLAIEDNVIRSAEIEYTQKERQIYDNLAVRMLESFNAEIFH